MYAAAGHDATMQFYIAGSAKNHNEGGVTSAFVMGVDTLSATTKWRKWVFDAGNMASFQRATSIAVSLDGTAIAVHT